MPRKKLALYAWEIRANRYGVASGFLFWQQWCFAPQSLAEETEVSSDAADMLCLRPLRSSRRVLHLSMHALASKILA